MHESQTALAGLRVLVVEDELLIALDIESGLQQLNCEPVGPAATVSEALSVIAGSGRLDGALLDLNLRGETILPVIEVLVKRDVPYILLTGYARRENDPPALRDARRLSKPFRSQDIATAMCDIFLRNGF